MSRKISLNIPLFFSIGWLFVCIDIGRKFDFLNDGAGFLLIAMGLLLIENRKKELNVALVLSLFLAPVSYYISKWSLVAAPSWNVVLLRCLPPLISIPIGIILAKNIDYITGKNKKKKKIANDKKQNQRDRSSKMIKYYLEAQIFDLACIVYFLPLYSSPNINMFNISSPLRFFFPLSYFVLMLLYIKEFKSS